MFFYNNSNKSNKYNKFSKNIISDEMTFNVNNIPEFTDNFSQSLDNKGLNYKYENSTTYNFNRLFETLKK